MRTVIAAIALLPICVFAQLPERIVQDRSLVIMDLPLQESKGFLIRGDWEKIAKEVQSMLTVINIDAIGYLHSDDWNASISLKQSYRLFFATRNVQIGIRIRQSGNLFTLSVHDFKNMSELWSTEAGSIRQAVIRLGNEIKMRNFEVENFLPIDNAEIFTDIPFSRWSASSTYPDQIRRLTLGVAQFEKESDNDQLRQLMKSYPFNYELFDYIDDEDAFRKGYQYVLFNLTTSGKSIRQLLNFNSKVEETMFISHTKGDSSSVQLISIPAEAKVTKFYIKQTVNKEIFVGKNWEADVSWQKTLANFIHNLNIAFNKI